jgi:RNA polymerase sigma factor (sigma-70 family)
MQTDNELIKSYVEDGCERAFTEFVERHVNMVFSAAMRETRSHTGLAEEITQSVFAELARKAASLARHPALAGWLYTCVRRMSANVLRAEERRQRRELQSQSMNELSSSDSAESSWQQIQSVLDDAMHQLNETERNAIVLRFLEERSLREVALALGLNENAAHVRVHRAVEKLRLVLARRGITSTASGLAAALAAGAVISAPSALAASVAASALAVSSASSTTFSFITLMTLTKLKLTLTVSVIAICCLTTTLLVRQRLQGKPSSLAFSGYATPEATLQTECWALSKGDFQLFLAGMTPGKRQQMEGKVAAHAGRMDDPSRITGFNILNKETISADEVLLTVRIEGEKPDRVQKMVMRRLDGEWKVAEATR